jgi:hypothetical protein
MSPRGRFRLGFLFLAAVVLAVWLARRDERPHAPPEVTAPAPTVAAPAPAPLDTPVPAASAPPPAEPLVALGGDAGGSWEGVDLEEVRRALPDNLYWETSVPTQDEAELARRAEVRADWNEQYGKVLSNTATEQEIEEYYAYRQRVSEDAIEFANYLLNHYERELPPKDVGLLELAIELHMARLEEIPRQIEDAHERRLAHDAAREAWRREQAAFEAEDPGVTP